MRVHFFARHFQPRGEDRAGFAFRDVEGFAVGAAIGGIGRTEIPVFSLLHRKTQGKFPNLRRDWLSIYRKTPRNQTFAIQSPARFCTPGREIKFPANGFAGKWQGKACGRAIKSRSPLRGPRQALLMHAGIIRHHPGDKTALVGHRNVSCATSDKTSPVARPKRRARDEHVPLE
jgi:hypothetical protein